MTTGSTRPTAQRIFNLTSVAFFTFTSMDTGSLVDEMRLLVGQMTRMLSRRIRNPELRRVLNPYEVLSGPESLITVGHRSYFKTPPRVHNYEPDDGRVVVGRYSSIAGDVEFLVGGFHHHRWVTTSPLGAQPNQIFSKGQIIIGNDVWIGRGAMIMCGVTIGDGAVVGARALVTKDVRPYSVVVGSPAKEIDCRFDDLTVERLLRLCWWDWPDELVERYAGQLQCEDVAGFLDAAEIVAPPDHSVPELQQARVLRQSRRRNASRSRRRAAHMLQA